MLCAGYTKVWDLSAGELVRLDGARGTTLRVTRGNLWITLENDTRDIVLAAGDSYTIDRGGLTLIEAQEITAVCAMRTTSRKSAYPATTAPRRHPVVAWLASVFAPDDLGGYSPVTDLPNRRAEGWRGVTTAGPHGEPFRRHDLPTERRGMLVLLVASGLVISICMGRARAWGSSCAR